MDENFIKESTSDELELDLAALFQQLKKQIKLIIVSVVLMLIVAFVYTNFFVEKKYASQARVYIAPKVTEGMVEYSSLTTGNLMVNNYMSILKGDKLLSKVADNTNQKFGVVKGSVSVSNDENTQIIVIRSTTNEPKLSKTIVDETVSVFQSDMAELLDVKNLVVIDSAKVSEVPVTPNLRKNILFGGIIGLVLSVGYIVIKCLLDNRLHNKKEAEEYLGLPVLAEVPLLED